MFDAEYINSRSLLYQMDARLKVILLFLFSITVAPLKSFPALFTAFTIAVIVLLFAAVPVFVLVKRLIPVNLMIVFLWCFLPFTTAGESIYEVYGLSVTREGVLLALILTIKANAMMILFIAFVVSTPVSTTGHAMSRIGVPDRLVHLLLFTYRYIFVIHDEYLRLKKAMLIRGFVPGTNLHTYRTYAWLVGMLLVKSADRAKRVHNAMLCRGFNGKFYSMTGFNAGKADIAAFIVMLLLIIVTGGIEWWQPIHRLLN